MLNEANLREGITFVHRSTFQVRDLIMYHILAQPGTWIMSPINARQVPNSAYAWPAIPVTVIWPGPAPVQPIPGDATQAIPVSSS